MSPHRAAGGQGTRSSPAPFPWRQAMAFGFGVLRLAPHDFWQMTPREIACAHEAVYGAPAAPMRGALAALMRQFPDGFPGAGARTDP